MKSTQVIPVYIKPELIPFLIREFQGTEARYFNQLVKAVDIDVRTPFGSFIRLQMDKLDYPIKDISKYNMFLKIRDNEYHQSKNFGRLYSYTKGNNHFLHLPKYAVDNINEYLNCVFKTSIFNYLEAWNEHSNKGLIDGVFAFMEKYDLLETDINPESLRRSYYRWKEKKDGKLRYYTKKTK